MVRLVSYGDNRAEVSMFKHIARGFLPENEKIKERVLFHPMLSSVQMQEALRTAELSLIHI